ncbi:hypothetical protein SSX86_028074 [Deinandra increscens subsp. villosa]|uniref:Uncharacterized protein n=1 Tax=Deinandra increscens subsp. villosa TaxID=3103831 RepID=A0AAP0GK27_9ASTR
MRIRKNAKTSAFLHTNSNLISHNHEPTLCLLNQSPWDIITFPSSPSIHLVRILLFLNSPPIPRSVPLIQTSLHLLQMPHFAASTKNTFDCAYDLVNQNRNQYDDEKIRDYDLYKKEDELGFMCEGNLIDRQNDAVWSTQKKAQCASSKSRDSRGTKKRAAAVTPKQNEFYYYSGFGPSWGKKRGGLGEKCTTFNACDTTTTSSSVYESDVDVEEDHKRAEPVPTMMLQTTWSGHVMPGKKDFDFVEQDERDDGIKIEKTVKKRGRKPMKARSLKSLM